MLLLPVPYYLPVTLSFILLILPHYLLPLVPIPVHSPTSPPLSLSLAYPPPLPATPLTLLPFYSLPFSSLFYFHFPHLILIFSLPFLRHCFTLFPLPFALLHLFLQSPSSLSPPFSTPLCFPQPLSWHTMSAGRRDETADHQVGTVAPSGRLIKRVML